MRYSLRYLNDFGILRDYNGNGFKLVDLAVYRQSGFEDDRKFTPKGEAGNTEKLECNLVRTKSTIKELCLCNPWEWFVTLTLDPKKYDRHDLGKFKKDLAQLIRNYRKRTGNHLQYLLIPEHHKDGCWHFHGFFMGIPADALHAFSLSEHLPKKIRERLMQGVQVYTWQEYADRFGYASIEPIIDPKRAAGYILKYITKDALITITELNAHAFFASQGLKRSVIVHQDILPRQIENPDFQNEHCAVKWFDDFNTAIQAFTENRT
ncbi:MAG: hypothetical protein ACI4WZ_06740 [Eubacteriales bacterium]